MGEDKNRKEINSQLIQFFKDKERSSSGKLWLDLGMFASIIIVETVLLFYLAYGKNKDVRQSLVLAMIPGVVTTATAMYQANEYDVDKENSKISENYNKFIKESTSQHNDTKLTSSQESEVK